MVYTLGLSFVLENWKDRLVSELCYRNVLIVMVKLWKMDFYKIDNVSVLASKMNIKMNGLIT